MLTHKTSKIIAANHATIYQVIKNVSNYPKFLPWLKESKVYDQTESQFKADLAISHGPWQAKYTSTVELTPPTYDGKSTIKSTAIKGQLDYLNSFWQIEKIKENVSRVHYSLEMSVKNKMLEMVLKPLMTPFADKIMAAFEAEICK